MVTYMLTRDRLVKAIASETGDTSVIGGLALRDEAVPVDALTWHLDPHPSGVKALTIELMCRPTRLPLPLLGHQRAATP